MSLGKEIPIRFKTLLQVASVTVVSLPPVLSQNPLPLQVVFSRPAQGPTGPGAQASTTVFRQVRPPETPKAFEVIQVKPYGGPSLAPPGLAVTVRSINTGVGIAGTTITVPHGLLIAPSIIFASISGRTGTVDANGRQGYRKGFGIGIVTPQFNIVRRCFGTHSDDVVGLTQADATFRNDSIIAVMAPLSTSPDTTSGILDIQSVDDTNVVFVVTEQFDASYRVHLQFIGGTDITYISLSTRSGPTTTGDQDITDLGFTPDIMFFIGGHLSQAPPDIQNDSSIFMGVCDNQLNQWTAASGTNDEGGALSGRARSYMKDGESICILAPTTLSPPDCRASVTQMLPTGFRLNWAKVTHSARRFALLAVQGGNWKVGNLLTQLDTTEHPIVTGFVPDGTLMVSQCKPVSVTDTVDVDDLWTCGFSQDSTVNVAQSISEKDLVSPTVVSTGVFHNDCYASLDNAGNVVARFGVSSRQSNGFSYKHSLADVAQNFVGYVAFGHIVPPTFSTVIKTVKPNGGGDYTSLNAAVQGELANHKNLISQNIILEFDCYAGKDVGGSLVIPGWHNTVSGYRVDKDHYIYINVVEGHAGLPVTDGSKYLLDVVDDINNGLLISAEYVRFKQCQVRMTCTSLASVIAAYRMGAAGMVAPTYWEFVNCLAIGQLTGGPQVHGFFPPSATFDVAGVTCVLINCLAYHFISQDTVMTGFNTANAVNQTIRLYNCTAYDCNQGFQDHSDVIHVNCLAVGCDNGWNTSTGPNASSDYNFSTNGPPGINGAYYPGTTQTAVLDAKGPHSRNGLPVLMVDPFNDDIRPQYGESSITGQGVNLTSDFFFPFSYDVAGNPRPAVGGWTIGAFENVQPSHQLVRWITCGAVTENSAVVKVGLIQAETNVYLNVSQNPDMSSPSLNGPVQSGSNNIATFNLPCTPNTKYYYQAVIAGVPLGPIGNFTSFPEATKPASFTIACGGCADTGSNSKIFTTVKSYNPLMFVWYGDLHYFNISSNDITLYRLAYEGVYLAPRQQQMIQSMSCDMVWDDHDWGKDNSDGTSIAGPAAYSAYKELWPNYPLIGTANYIYHSYVIGRVRFILTDSRSHRDPNSNPDGPLHTMLGTEQLAWLFSELLLARNLNQLVFLFLPNPWIAPLGDNFGDDWGGFDRERKIIADFMESNGIRNVIRFCGDMHSAAIDDGTYDKYATDNIGNSLPTILPYPLNQSTQTYGGSYSDGIVEHAQTRLMGFAGIIVVTDDSKKIEVDCKVVNELGVVLEHKFTFNIVYQPYFQEFPTPESYVKESPQATSYTPEGPRATTFTQETPSGPGYTKETPSPTEYTKEDGT